MRPELLFLLFLWVVVLLGGKYLIDQAKRNAMEKRDMKARAERDRLRKERARNGRSGRVR